MATLPLVLLVSVSDLCAFGAIEIIVYLNLFSKVTAQQLETVIIRAGYTR